MSTGRNEEHTRTSAHTLTRPHTHSYLTEIVEKLKSILPAIFRVKISRDIGAYTRYCLLLYQVPGIQQQHQETAYIYKRSVMMRHELGLSLHRARKE